MVDYLYDAVIQPLIPKKLITEKDKEFFQSFGITIKDENEKYYLYADEWTTEALIESTEPGGKPQTLSEDALHDRFKDIIRRSDGELRWISIESAYTCSESKPDGFGGGAIFITKDEIKYCYTSQWIEGKIQEIESRNASAPTPTPEEPLFAVVMEGGLVQAIVSDKPSETRVIVIDYDVNDMDYEDSDVIKIKQPNGKMADAVGSIRAIETAGIDLKDVIHQLNNKR